MGKGDKRSKRGKITIGSYGNSRRKRAVKSAGTAEAPKKAAAKKAAPKKDAAKKPAAKKATKKEE